MSTYRDRKGTYRTKPEDTIPQKRKSVYGVFIEDQKILLVTPTWADYWELPGGGVEIGESLVEALTREFLEETGFEIVQFDQEPIHVEKTKFYSDDQDVFFDSELIIFMIHELGKHYKNHMNTSEIRDATMVAISDLNRNTMHEIQFEILEAILSSQK